MIAGSAPSFVDVDHKGDITVRNGEKLRLACTGYGNRFVNAHAQVPDILVTCKGRKFFKTWDKDLILRCFHVQR